MKSWVGKTETHGANRSPLIDSMNKYVKNPVGSPYCAATVCYSEYQSGKPKHRTGLARNVRDSSTFSSNDVIMGKRKVERGSYVIYQKGETIFGHIETAIKDWKSIEGETIGGNTSPTNKGSQSNGGGFYKRWRKIEPYSYSKIRWITPNKE